MNNKMSYNDQQRLKRTISSRLRAAAQSAENIASQSLSGQMVINGIRNMPRMNGQQPYQGNMPQMNGGQAENPHRVRHADDAHVHVMPDGMTCMPNKAVKVSDKEEKTEVSRAKVLRNAFVFSELISEPVCKKRHRNRRR
ncbi:MAG: hypothetical protein J5981_04695 [Lachnospira sp.]|nr:hypothetical protein [Lachnospira sp.]